MMKYHTALTSAALASLSSIAEARVVTPNVELELDPTVTAALLKRAFPANAPYGYVPQASACPSDSPSIRSADSLSSEEREWTQVRRNNTIEPMRDLLGRLNITGLDTDQYINDNRDNASALPNIGIALSGGGYRAMLNGAGVVEAFDSRTPNSTSTGHLGGLLQSATYLAGLSGGNWMVGSLYTNNFTSVNEIISSNTPAEDSGSLWQLGNSILQGPESDGIQLFDSVGYYASLVDMVGNKDDAGFETTITDYWGRALSYQLVNATDGGPAYTWSSIARQDWFTNGDAPLPFLVADGRRPGETLVPTNTTVFTFSPWELGTFDPTVYAFAPLRYVGTNFSSGEPINDNSCVEGFDNVGFVMGTSSSLFNAALTTVNGTEADGALSSALQDAIVNVLQGLGEEDYDIAYWVNPFYNYRNDSNPYASSRQLTLVDGGLDGQNIPLNPLIQPVREVDVIFAVDSSADTNDTFPTPDSSANWPSGFAIRQTYERQQTAIGNDTAFPDIPSVNTFFNLGLNNGPTFFGCDASAAPAPLIVYMPNAPYVYTSNVSTFDLAYNDTERNAIILNGYNGATQGNGTLDEQWPACVGCAILARSLDRTGTEQPEVCQQCFDRYCWDGSTDDSEPGTYAPEIKLSEVSVTSGAGRSSRNAVAIGLGLVAALCLIG